jgi:hypothetical protein
MSDAQWRGDPNLRDAKREFIRRNLPSGRDGFVAEDIDLVIRHFSNRYDQDSAGRLRLTEVKVARGMFRTSKAMTLGLLDAICRSSDMAERYEGFFLIYTETDNWDECDLFVVNGIELSRDSFIAWLNGELNLRPVLPKNVPTNVAKWRRQP